MFIDYNYSIIAERRSNMENEELEKKLNFSEEDIRPNEFTQKCVKSIIPVVSLAIVLYVAFSAASGLIPGLYIALPDVVLTVKGLLAALIVLVITYFIGKVIPSSDTRLKYVYLFASLIMVTLVQTFMSYIMTFVAIAPILIAAQYPKKTTLHLAYTMTLVTSAVSVILGYKIGLCDANMILLPTEKVSEYGAVLSGEIKPLKDVIISLFVLFILPRIILISAFVPLINAIVDNRKEIILSEYKSRFHGEHDGFTGLYNRNKYNDLLRSFTSYEKTAVLFFDVNNLKYINDTRGHELGDRLILMAADSVQRAAFDNMYVFRFGGDEFLVVIPNGTEKDAQEFVERWTKILDTMNDSSPDLKCEMAYGYAADIGPRFHSCLRDADMKMYENKIAQKQAREIFTAAAEE